MLIQTIRGLIEKDKMEVRDMVEWGDNFRKIVTEYWYQGELVKCDVAASMLRGPEAEHTNGQIT
jgi:hypothetical protein